MPGISFRCKILGSCIFGGWQYEAPSDPPSCILRAPLMGPTLFSLKFAILKNLQNLINALQFSLPPKIAKYDASLFAKFSENKVICRAYFFRLGKVILP